mmetsp:Transcript_18168/g.30122  ORF Transcript_18168/g.30122 Transcript_18168/m.30122 type:complete len:475 (-) Transcript_18168:10-1434(-)|eukprot:CAMPEP_0119007268 /NCGR_PEP_ID=MMETSP1176-20130426/2896_1 /TAXON_ID=265551 /ORGANISM="Synedropsis recta cf, Strain CCMP1620" /LENGTH=474 /DNA_ID=CAMNT_0006959383 /DNA_START=26 /DNA_END=1450 /DNA_ORIENTATION=+
MASLDSSGANISIRGNNNPISSDFNPYAYPYFHSQSDNAVYDLIVRFGKLWRQEEDHDLDLLVHQIQQRCQAEPHEVQWKDSCGDTALHRLCQAARLPSSTEHWAKTQYFVDICQCMLEAHPLATVMSNNWNETPLHQFSNHCGLPVSAPFFAELSEEKKIGFSLIVTFFQMLTRNGGAHVKNYWGSYALHDACALQGLKDSKTTLQHTWPRALHLRMIKHLIKEAPEALIKRDDSINTPLDRAVFGCGEHAVRMLVERVLVKQRVQPSLLPFMMTRYLEPSSSSDTNIGKQIMQQLDNRDDPREIAEQLGLLWTNTLLICNAQVYESARITTSKEQPLLHAMIQAECFECCIRLVARLFPEDLFLRNTAGETVLTLALCSRTPSIGRTVLHENIALASMPNSKGQLPLHVAIQKLTWANGLEEIFCREPRALMLRDPESLLYPFMLANHDVTSSFELLRADPSVLTLCSPRQF